MPENAAATATEAPAPAGPPQDWRDKVPCIVAVVNTAGLVLRVGEPLPGPDGKPAKFNDANGKPVEVTIGAIFLIPEAAEIIESGDDEEPDAAETRTIPAHYEIWALQVPYFYRVWKSQVQYDETLCSPDHAAEMISHRILDLLPEDVQVPPPAAEPEEAEDTEGVAVREEPKGVGLPAAADAPAPRLG